VPSVRSHREASRFGPSTSAGEAEGALSGREALRSAARQPESGKVLVGSCVCGDGNLLLLLKSVAKVLFLDTGACRCEQICFRPCAVVF